MDYPGPVGGTPLLPPAILTKYFVFFLVLLLLIYSYLHFKKKPPGIRHKAKLLVVTAVLLKISLLGGAGLVAAYWLLPTPSVFSTTPAKTASSFAINEKIEIVFDRPVSRKLLEKSITPEVAGIWVFENPMYATHLYRKLTFLPTFSLEPDTVYTIKLAEIANTAGVSPPYNFEFKFRTQKTPEVAKVDPADNSENIEIETSIKVQLTEPNNMVSRFSFELTPEIPVQITLDSSKTVYTLKPRVTLKQGTSYKLKVKKSDLTLNLEDRKVIQRGPQETAYEGAFTTKEAPGIASFAPSGSNVLPNSPIVVEFSQRMDKSSVDANFSIEPVVSGTVSWKDDKTFSFNPERLTYETDYKIKLARGTKAVEGGFLEEDIVKSFSTIGSVKIINFYPKDGVAGAGVGNPTEVNFDQEVDHASAISKFAVTPEVSGSFSWDGNTLIFTPDADLSYTTSYTVSVDVGVESINGLISKQVFSTTFTTQDTTHRLDVPAYLQQHPLSCEVSALRMILAYRGIAASEEELLDKVGYDTTPHKDGVWGNPHIAYVGNVDGRQMTTGYGVYWNPIARVAKDFRDAEAFEGATVEQLTREVSNGNPVIIWVYSRGGVPTYWYTPDNQRIYAVSGEHTVTVVGFVGPGNNPSRIIVNDPLVGQVYWSRSLFDRKWSVFGNSGVVVR